MKLLWVLVLLSGCAQQQGVFRNVNLIPEEEKIAQDALVEICERTNEDFCGIIDASGKNSIAILGRDEMFPVGGASTHHVLWDKTVFVKIKDFRNGSVPQIQRPCAETWDKWLRVVVTHEFLHVFSAKHNHISGNIISANLNDIPKDCQMTQVDIDYMY